MPEGLTLEDVKKHIDSTIVNCARNRRLLPVDDFVYVIGEVGSDNPVKVGHANYIDDRLASLQIGNHRRLEAKYAFRTDDNKLSKKIEKKVHHHLSDYHVSGEWFAINADAAAQYIELISGIKPESIDAAMKARKIKRAEYFKIAEQIRTEHWSHILKLMRGDTIEMLTGNRLSDFILDLKEMKNKRAA